MTNHTEIQHVATISELHRNLELAKPLHPLVSLIRLDDLDFSKYVELVRFSYGFYTVSLKRGIQNKVHYGHRSYDFDEGVLALVKPHQVMAMQAHPDDDITGWMLAVTPIFYRDIRCRKRSVSMVSFHMRWMKHCIYLIVKNTCC